MKMVGLSCILSAVSLTQFALAANPVDDKGEYYLDDQGVKHYYVFWDAASHALNNSFSWTREDAAAGNNTYGGWQDQIDGPIWTFAAGVSWPGSRYVGDFTVYGFHFENAGRSVFRWEQESPDKTLKIGAYGIRSEMNDFSFITYSTIRRIRLEASQTWSGPEASALSSHPFYVVPGSNAYFGYIAEMTAADDAVLTLQGDMVYGVLDYGATNNLSNADVVIKAPAILAHFGYWKNSGWHLSYLKARSITIDGGTGIYFGGRTTNASGETIAMKNQPVNGDSWNRYGALGSGPYLTTNVAAKIILKNGATLTAESETQVSSGVKIVVPAGETAYLKGAFKFLDNLTTIEIGEGGYLDISAATFTGTGSAKVTGKGTFGPRTGTDTKGDWYLDNTLTKRYFLYQNTFTGKCWSLNKSSYTREGAQAGTGTTSWQANSIFTLEKDTSYSGAYSFGGTPSVCGFLHEAPNGVRFEGGQTFYLGSYGIKATSGNKQLGFWCAKANPILTASQTWEGTNATELSATPYVVNVPYMYDGTYRAAIRAYDDVVWTLAGDIVVSMKTQTNDFSNADVVIKKPAVLSIPVGTSFGTGRLKARSVTLDGGSGLRFGADTSVSMTGRVGNGGFEAYGIGSSPLISPDQVAGKIYLKSGATLLAKAMTTISGGVTISACDETSSAFVGDFMLADDQTVVRSEAGSTLDLTGCTIAGNAFQIAGGGKVLINLTKITAPFTVDPATEVEYTIAGEGRFYISDENLAKIGGNVLVAAGTMVIDNVASIPAGCTISTAGDAALMLIDATGFDPETMMGGTKRVAAADPLIVTDVPRTGVVGVGAGETIEIWGDGLGADATLFATNGATILFRHAAEIAAPLQTKNSVSITVSDSSVTGLVSGAWTSLDTTASSQSINIYGPGMVRFSGGAELRGSTFKMRAYAQAEIVEKPFNAYVSLLFYDGHLTIKDGGKWKQQKVWLYLYLNQYLEGSGTAVLEIGKGGEYWRHNNTTTIIGQPDDSSLKTAKLYINGGYFETAVTDCFDLNGNGIIEIDNGGYMSCECPVGGGGNKPRRVILGDGIWGNEAVYSQLKGKALFADGKNLSVEVKGNILFDFYNMYGDNTVVTNVATQPASWTFRNGSTCRVRGRSDKRSTFVLRDMTVEPGACFDLASTNPVADVKFAIGDADLAMTWVVPAAGKNVGRIIGDGGALTASYLVPAGSVFDAGNYDGWYEGFDGVASIDSLTFKEGSTFLFPFFGSDAALALPGTLTVPAGTNDYQVSRKGGGTTVEGATVLTANGGIVGDCTWRCTRGVNNRHASLVADGNALKFSYNPPGAVIILR